MERAALTKASWRGDLLSPGEIRTSVAIWVGRLPDLGAFSAKTGRDFLGIVRQPLIWRGEGLRRRGMISQSMLISCSAAGRCPRRRQTGLWLSNPTDRCV